jgi:hypothetical protein
LVFINNEKPANQECQKQKHFFLLIAKPDSIYAIASNLYKILQNKYNKQQKRILVEAGAVCGQETFISAVFRPSFHNWHPLFLHREANVPALEPVACLCRFHLYTHAFQQEFC